MSAAEDFDRELERCDREIAAMCNQAPTQPAILTTLGMLDWEGEKRLIEKARRERAMQITQGAAS